MAVYWRYRRSLDMEPELCVRSFKVQDVEPRVGKEEGQDSDQGLALSTTSCSKAEPKKSKNSLDFQIFKRTVSAKVERYISFNL